MSIENNSDALTMLYLEKSNISAMSPSDFVKKYYEVRSQISGELKKHQSDNLDKFYGK